MSFIDQPAFTIALTHLGVLRIQGSDAKKFLQGQITCDLEDILANQSRLGAHCNPQGRIISLFRIIRYQDDYLLQMPKSLVPIAQAAFKKYAVFYKNLTLRDDTDSFRQLGYCGNHLQEFFSVLPLSPNQVVTSNGAIIVKITDLPERYEICYDVTQSNETLLQLASITQTTPSWESLNINEGLPSIYPETSEIFLPHDINLPSLLAVSFKKGCYTGQEIIARMEYKGKLKKKLITAEAESSVQPIRGGDVFVKGKPCGHIVDYCQISYNTFRLLMVIPESELTETLTLDPDQTIILTGA